MLHLTVEQFALANIALTLVWLALAVTHRCVPSRRAPVVAPALGGGGGGARARRRAVAGRRSDARDAGCRSTPRADAAAGIGGAPGREGHAAAAVRARRARARHPSAPSACCFSKRPVYAFIGSTFEGGGLAVGPGYRAHLRRLRHHQRARRLVDQELPGRRAVGRPARVGARHACTVRLQRPLARRARSGLLRRDRRRPARRSSTRRRAPARWRACRRAKRSPSAAASTWCRPTPGRRSAPSRRAWTRPTARRALFAEVDTRTTPGYTTTRRLLPRRLHRLPRDRRRALHASSAWTPRCSSSSRSCARTG